MIIKNKKTFSIGAVLAVTFLGVLVLIFSPVFGDGKNGLVFSDDMFNKLSKGSSYFIPKVIKSNEKYLNTDISLTVKLEKPEENNGTMKMLTAAGAVVKNEGPALQISGNLGALMSKVLQDADDMYKNDGEKVSDRYGIDEKVAMTSWWNLLKVMDKELKNCLLYTSPSPRD